jgi:hypothetical protein
LERENAGLNKLVAELSLEKAALKDVAEVCFQAASGVGGRWITRRASTGSRNAEPDLGEP